MDVIDTLTLLRTRTGQYKLAFAIAAAIPVIRGLLNICAFGPLGRRLSREASRSGPNSQIGRQKWNEACWKATYRVFMVSVCLIVSYQEKFLLHPAKFWEGCNKFPPCNFPDISTGLRLAFAMELGFYLEAVPFLIFFEVRRKDYLENLVHHLVTLGLIFYASELNFLKVGVAIILCHEINDIFMELAKLARYAGNNAATTVLFTVFAVSWVATRLVYFPAAVIWNIYDYVPQLAIRYNVQLSPHREIYLALLSTLLVLHIYWSILIGKIAVDQLTKGESHDIREESSTDASSVAEAVPCAKTSMNAKAD